MIEGISRFTVQEIQTEVGYTWTHLRNAFGGVDRVDYLGGATFATDENNVNGNEGVTMGSFINIKLEGEINNNNFDEFVTQTPLYMHEYGHYIDGQGIVGVYFQTIGLPSAMSNWDWFNRLFGIGDSNFYYTEKRANRKAATYFRKYGVNWSDFDEDEWPQ